MHTRYYSYVYIYVYIIYIYIFIHIISKHRLNESICKALLSANRLVFILILLETFGFFRQDLPPHLKVLRSDDKLLEIGQGPTDTTDIILLRWDIWGWVAKRGEVVILRCARNVNWWKELSFSPFFFWWLVGAKS